MTSLELYFDPTLTSRQRLLCRMFWKSCKIEHYDDIARQINHLTGVFELTDPAEVFDILNKCHAFDTRYHCQVCRQLRKVESPLQLKQPISPTWRCQACLLLTS